jgi:hypothetical protein
VPAAKARTRAWGHGGDAGGTGAQRREHRPPCPDERGPPRRRVGAQPRHAGEDAGDGAVGQPLVEVARDQQRPAGDARQRELGADAIARAHPLADVAQLVAQHRRDHRPGGLPRRRVGQRERQRRGELRRVAVLDRQPARGRRRSRGRDRRARRRRHVGPRSEQLVDLAPHRGGVEVAADDQRGAARPVVRALPRGELARGERLVRRAELDRRSRERVAGAEQPLEEDLQRRLVGAGAVRVVVRGAGL